MPSIQLRTVACGLNYNPPNIKILFLHLNFNIPSQCSQKLPHSVPFKNEKNRLLKPFGVLKDVAKNYYKEAINMNVEV